MKKLENRLVTELKFRIRIMSWIRIGYKSTESSPKLLKCLQSTNRNHFPSKSVFITKLLVLYLLFLTVRVRHLNYCPKVIVIDGNALDMNVVVVDVVVVVDDHRSIIILCKMMTRGEGQKVQKKYLVRNAH